jgi:hypothetical protein
MTVLHDNSSYARVICITIHIKGFLDVELSQYGCGGEKLLQSEEILFTLFTPFELGILLKKFGHQFGNLGEIWNESAIVSHQSEKATDLCY